MLITYIHIYLYNAHPYLYIVHLYYTHSFIRTHVQWVEVEETRSPFLVLEQTLTQTS